MRSRCFAVIAALAAVTVVSLVPAFVQAQAPKGTAGATTWTQKTPWGDPDLQGDWTGSTTTPMERPIEGKVVVTDPEEPSRLFDPPPTGTGPAEAGRQSDPGTYNAF